MSHYRHRRDNNEGALVQLAEQVGGLWLPSGPLDGWLWWRGWHLCEIKDPARRGSEREYTPAQKVLMSQLGQHGAVYHVLRTEDDMLRLMDARRLA